MTSNNYANVKIPNELVKEVDALIGTRGFRSRAEIVKQALRNLLQAYQEKEA